ncbi:MAG: hotdog fold thioesterase [Burkholderiales bacterium]|jgi:1,4-dihydroxy-2-naphthoyl-CoA hydrolase|nr:hotdog fold thioesterase [Burkholderiales bacterium]
MTTSTIWQKPIDLATIAATGAGTAVEHLGIEVHTILDDGLVARMPVDARTRQPMGLLHGGVSVVLAETLGSLGAYFACPPGQVTVGLDINANHLRAVRSGWVTGTAKPIHLGRSTHVWAIDITNEAGQLVCVSRITMAILSQPPGTTSGAPDTPA